MSARCARTAAREAEPQTGHARTHGRAHGHNVKSIPNNNLQPPTPNVAAQKPTTSNKFLWRLLGGLSARLPRYHDSNRRRVFAATQVGSSYTVRMARKPTEDRNIDS